MTPPDRDFESPAEQRLDSHLEIVRAEPPAPGRSLTRRIFRTLRWQRVLIVPLRAVAAVTSGVLAGVRTLIAGRRSPR